jgi:hypothetical protein
MARAKKPEEKPKEGATLTMDVDTFVRTRDSVVTGLATLQDAIQTLSSAYIKHTNAVLGEHGAGLDVDSALARLGDNPLLRLGEFNRVASPAFKAVAPLESPVEKKDVKEKKKRQHDPNAPKRPLTPFFLYMQTARPIIATELGPDAAKGAVSAEGTKKWGDMEKDDKQLWTNLYRENLKFYNARMHSYKAGNLAAKDMSDDEAAAYAEEHNLNVEADTADAQLVGESSAAAAVEEDAEADAEGEPEVEKEPTPPPKTPKPRSTRKTKGKAAAEATPALSEAIVPPSSASAAQAKSAEKEKSPEKKRKRTSTKKGAAAVDEPINSIEKEELAVETPKAAPKPRKKKAKADN